MHFRDAIISDLPLIVDIYNSTIAGRMVTADTEPVTVTDKLNWFHEHTPSRRPLLIVEDEKNKTIGWVSFRDFYGRPAYDGTAEISIYLDENGRGKGYGKQILQYSIEKSPDLGIHVLLGFIFAHNLISIQLFKHHGFDEWGHLDNIAVLDGQERSLKIFGKKISK